MDAQLQSLYRETLMKHSRDPSNRGPMDNASHSQEARNPLCGDQVTVHLKLENERITDARFEAQCCSICMASASMLTERVVGMTVQESKAFAQTLSDQLNRPGATVDLDPDDALHSLSGVKAFPSRIRCATLPWEALQDALPSDP